MKKMYIALFAFLTLSAAYSITRHDLQPEACCKCGESGCGKEKVKPTKGE